MNYRIDENVISRELKVGDVLISRDGEICSVNMGHKIDTGKAYFCIRDIFGRDDIKNLTEDTLKELTKKAKYYNYHLYPQEDFELVLRRIG